METPKIMRDCLRDVVENGSHPDQVGKDPYLLAKEFKRLGYTWEQALEGIEKWAGHCDPPLTVSRLREVRKTVKQVLEGNDPPLSCRPGCCLVRDGYCFLKGDGDPSCEFNEAVKAIVSFVRSRNVLEGCWAQWDSYLREKHGAIGQLASVTYDAIREVELQRAIPQGQTVFVGLAALRAVILARHRDFVDPHPRRMLNGIKLLESFGLVAIDRAPQPIGKHAHGPKRANGYRRTVPLPAPPLYSQTMRVSQIICSKGAEEGLQ